jgi:hypothetical protein
MIDTDPTHDGLKAAPPLDVILSMLAAALIGIGLLIFGAP